MKLLAPRLQRGYTIGMTSEPKSLPWGLRVRELRTQANLTQEQLADMIGTTKATISKMERSTKRPHLDWLEKLARALRVELGSLLHGAGSPVSSSIRMIPVIGMIAAGNWREAIEEPDDYVPINTAGLPQRFDGAEVKSAFALRVDGDSLDKIAPEGTYVAIDPNSKRLMDGMIYAVMNEDGDATLKVYRAEPARLEPSSSNPVHQAIMLGDEPITIIGMAFYSIRPLSGFSAGN